MIKNKKGNISITVLTAMTFIFASILLVYSITLGTLRKQVSHRDDYINGEYEKDNLLVIGNYILDSLNDDDINFDINTIYIEIKSTFKKEFTLILEGKKLQIIYGNYYREITKDTTYVISNIIRK